MSIANCVVHDSNGVYLARKIKKEKDLTQREQSLAEGTEESCWGAPRLLDRIDAKGYRQRGGSFICVRMGTAAAAAGEVAFRLHGVVGRCRVPSPAAPREEGKSDENEDIVGCGRVLASAIYGGVPSGSSSGPSGRTGGTAGRRGRDRRNGRNGRRGPGRRSPAHG